MKTREYQGSRPKRAAKLGWGTAEKARKKIAGRRSRIEQAIEEGTK